jgi:taurine dioxygenase
VPSAEAATEASEASTVNRVSNDTKGRTVTATETALDVKPIAGALGAHIHGVDLDGSLTPDVVADIETMLARFGVVFFTGQNLDVDGHARLASALGRPKLPPEYIPNLAAEGHPEICVLSTENQFAYASSMWHSDVTWEAAPPRYSILHMQESPDVGGDTVWSSQHVAFETLSGPLQVFLRPLTARHQHPIDLSVGVDHPLVCRHPVTDREALFCNKTFTQKINELAALESTTLLNMLYSHAARPEFTCRWRWSNGDIAIWDNHFVQHYALGDFGAARRKIHRIEIEGAPPIPTH